MPKVQKANLGSMNKVEQGPLLNEKKSNKLSRKNFLTQNLEQRAYRNKADNEAMLQ
ncbi:16674_t:CDS:2 [Funneliformis mosseae]|uniref:16674_t:CDS:1 n=1 Tax=Funneliformis mosseae TaxID=27381 RepID=A0A9N9G4Q1_FUNMO|nr:16674_t:CDS:2 [Funneliformis mosseae]